MGIFYKYRMTAICLVCTSSWHKGYNIYIFLSFFFFFEKMKSPKNNHLSNKNFQPFESLQSLQHCKTTIVFILLFLFFPQFHYFPDAFFSISLSVCTVGLCRNNEVGTFHQTSDLKTIRRAKKKKRKKKEVRSKTFKVGVCNRHTFLLKRNRKWANQRIDKFQNTSIWIVIIKAKSFINIYKNTLTSFYSITLNVLALVHNSILLTIHSSCFYHTVCHISEYANNKFFTNPTPFCWYTCI